MIENGEHAIFDIGRHIFHSHALFYIVNLSYSSRVHTFLWSTRAYRRSRKQDKITMDTRKYNVHQQIKQLLP